MSELAYPTGTRDVAAEALKVPPHSAEAEQSLLGGLMINNTAWDDVVDLVNEQDFYRRDHRLIFRAITALANAGSPLDAVTLSEWLSNHNELDNAGGLAYLGLLASNTPSASNIKAYAAIVRERSVFRQLIEVGSKISNSAFNTEGRNSSDLLDRAEQLVFEIAEQSERGKAGFKSITSLLTDVVDIVDTLYQSKGGIIGRSTGFKDIDNITLGLQPSDLIVVAGRPSMGKTAFAMNLAENVAVGEKLPVAIFSMEMPGEQLVMRMLASLGTINLNKIRTGDLGDDDWSRITSNMTLLQNLPLFIDDSAALSPGELRARARRLMREHGQLGLIVVDYLQLMKVNNSSENRATEISEISRELKALAKELKVPVIALSQLNRSLEQRTDKRPIMSDLRESGAIEQDADVILFIYRDEVYHDDSPDKGLAEIIIAKQRNGPIGTRRLTFQGQFTRFKDYAADIHAGIGFRDAE